MMKRTSTLLIVAMLFFSMFAFNEKAEGSSLKDINNHWAKKEIDYLIERGIISGYPDGTFKPNEFVTRAQVSIMIGRALGVPGEQPVHTRHPDVPASITGSGYIHELDKIDHMTPDSDGFFRPYKLVTRAEVTEHLLRTGISNIYLAYTKNPFTDVYSTQLHAASIISFHRYGIVSGYVDGTFRPNEPITRAQFSVFMARYLQVK